MRLLSLSANMPSFRTVNFRREGMSLVIAEQKTEKSAVTSTYNGVGKSLMLELLHFCLGGNRNHALETHLPDWEFHLTFQAGGTDHTIQRPTDPAKKIKLDGEDIGLKELRDFLDGVAFSERPAVSQVTFRALISRFIRSGKHAYNQFQYVHEGDLKQPYIAMLVTAFLLGLDLELAKRKHDQRKLQEQRTETLKQLEKDPLFSTLLADNTLEFELLGLRDEAVRLSANLANFRVADDYHSIELEADAIKRRLDRHRRDAVKIGEALFQIERSLRVQGDLAPDDVAQLYAEAQIALPELVKRRIEEVIAFHHELSRKRALRLTRERQRLAQELAAANGEIHALSAALDDKLRYLSEHRALDQYVAVSKELSEVQRQIARIEEGRNVREAVDHELKKLKVQLAEGSLETDEYLASAKTMIAEATGLFRSFARQLYGPARRSGLTIDNDSGDNQLRYKIDAHIAGDAAEGINEAKIFCFDMTLLSLQRGHNLQFAAHDSTLFSPVDPRQRLAMFRIADHLCKLQGFQYIATLNMHDLSTMLEQPGDHADLFSDDSIVLRLTDAEPEEKLLGIDIDMNYMQAAASKAA